MDGALEEAEGTGSVEAFEGDGSSHTSSGVTPEGSALEEIEREG